MNEIAPISTAPDLSGARILILTPDLSQAGLGRLAVDLAIEAHKRGGTPTIASSGGILKLELQRRKLNHLTLPDISASALGHMMAVFKLSNWMKFHRIDYIHAVDFSLGRFAYDIMQKTAKPCVLSLNQPVISILTGRGGDILRDFTRIIVPSSHAREQLLGQLSLPESMVRAIIPGINLSVVSPRRISPQKVQDLEKNWQLPDDRPVMVMPDCPLDPVIFDTIAASFRELKEKDIYTVVFAPLSERSYILQRISNLGLSSHVIVTSDAADRITALWLAHTVLITGFNGQDSILALIEAQAMGRPIVAFDRNGINEMLLKDPATILLAQDQISRLTPALIRSLKISTEQRHAFAHRARNFVDTNFDRAEMIGDILGVYGEMQEIQN